jgi:hypothetical protein
MKISAIAISVALMGTASAQSQEICRNKLCGLYVCVRDAGACQEPKDPARYPFVEEVPPPGKDPELPSVQYKMTNELGNVQATAFLESGTLRFKGDRSSAVDVSFCGTYLTFRMADGTKSVWSRQPDQADCK